MAAEPPPMAPKRGQRDAQVIKVMYGIRLMRLDAAARMPDLMHPSLHAPLQLP